ncbi:unnamed protein product, partial [marine sediment metagenome]
VKIPNVQNVLTLQVWDLAGQPRFRWVRYAFYKGAKGIVYTFDLTRRETFDSLLTWKEEVEIFKFSKKEERVFDLKDKIEELKKENISLKEKDTLLLAKTITAINVPKRE